MDLKLHLQIATGKREMIDNLYYNGSVPNYHF